MADYSWAYDQDEKAKEFLSTRRLEELRTGYTTRQDNNSTHCIRCGCVVGDRKIHDGICPWSEEMFQAGLEKLGEL